MLESNNVKLRKLTLDDADALAHLGNNINIFRFTSDSFPHPYTKEKAIEFISIGQIRVLEKKEFELEGIMKQALFKMGKFYDNYRYGSLKS